MKRFFRNMGRGYMTIAEPFNDFWSYLISRGWRCPTEDTLYATALLVAVILLTPPAYLCVAPIAAVLEGMRGEGE